MRTAAQAKRDRRDLMRAIERELKTKNRAKLVRLRDQWRTLRAEQRAELAGALQRCRERKPPKLAEVRAELRRQRAAAKEACSLDLGKARGLKDKSKQAKAELVAERAYQSALRRIESANRRKEKAARRPLAKTRASESDDEVRGNIPPELVPLFDRVRRQIRGSDRMSRTEAFLQYAHDHESEGETWAALEDRVDETIRALERRQSMANPKKAKKAKKKPHARAAQASKRAPTKKKSRAAKPSKKATRRAVGRWWDRILASREARRYPPGDRATLHAAYLKLPARQRAAQVGRMFRAGGRQRRAAVAIARAEHTRAEGPPARRANPRPMTDAAALEEYSRTHWGRRGRQSIRSARAADPAYGTATILGELVEVVYETRKGRDRELVHYVHPFEGPRPKLAYNAGGLVIVGGGYKVRAAGITG